ncbi:unnamed protein product [Closterium sp. NIES-54]
MFPCLTSRQAPLLPLPPQLTVRLAHSGLLATVDSTGPVRRCSRSLLLACQYCSRSTSTALPVPRAVSLCHALATLATTLPSLLSSSNRIQPPFFITLYFIVTRLPDSLRFVRDHFLSLDPTSLTVDLLEQHLLAAETSAVAVGAARGTPRTPFFERTSGLLLLARSPAAARARVAGVVEVSAGEVVGAAVEVVEAVEAVARVGALVAAVVATEGVATVGLVLVMEVLEEATGSNSSVGARPSRPSSFHRCFSRLDDAWRAEFGDEVERPRWADLLRSGDAIFDLDFDVIPFAMYALSASAQGDCYRCVPPNPGIEAAALGASESVLPGTMPAKALHTFTLDSGASCCFFCDSTTLNPLSAPVPVRLDDPSAGPVVTHSSTILLCLAVPYGSLSGLHLLSFSTNLVSTATTLDSMVTTTTRGQRVSICTCTRTGRHLATFTRRPVSSLYTQATEPPQEAASAQVPASGHVAPPCSYRQLSQKTLLWNHRLGHPSLPRLRGMHSRLLVSGLSRSLPPLPPSLTPPCVPCVEGRQRTAPHSSLSSTTALLQTLHMDVWGPACVSGQGRERHFLLVVDNVTRYTTVFPLRSKGEGPTPSGVSQVDPLPCSAPFEVAIGSGAARGAVSGGAASGGAEPGVAESEGAGSGGAEPGGAEPAGVEPVGVEPGVLTTGAGGAGAPGAGGAGVTTGAGGTGGTTATGPGGASTRGTGAAETGGVGGVGVGDPTELGASRAGGSGAGGAGAGGAGARGNGAGGAGAGGAGVGGTGAGGAGAGGTAVGGTGVGGTGAGGTGAGGAGAVDPRGTVRPRTYFVPLLQQVLRVPSSTSRTPPLLCPPPDQSQLPLKPASPLLSPSPCTEQSDGLTQRREPASRPVSPIRTACHIPRSRPPPVPGTHAMALRPSFVPLRVPLPAPSKSTLPAVPDREADRACAISPTVSRLLVSAVTDPSFESAAASALVAELLEFAAACRLDYTTALVAGSAFASPPSVGGECALGTNVLEDRQEEFECLAAAVPRFASMLLAPEGDPDAPDIPTPRSYAEAITGPYSSQWQAAMDAEMASWKTTGTYVDEVPPPGANIVDGLWIFRLKRHPGSSPAFKVRCVARGLSQRQGVDYFQTFSPIPKMTTLRVLLHVVAQRDNEVHSLNFSTAFLQDSLHEEIWLRCPPGFIGSFPAGTQWSLRRPVYGLRQAPREWHDALTTTLVALGFAPSTADPSMFLRTDTSLPPFYVLVYVDDLVFSTANTEALTLVKSELQKRHTCTGLGELRSYIGLQITRDRARRTITLTQSHMVHQVLQRFGFQFSSRAPTPLMSSMGLVLGGRGPVVLTGDADASWVDDLAMQWSSKGYTFSLGSGSVSWRSTCLSSVFSSSCDAEIYARAMAAQELRWLTYLLIDLGEQPRLPPVLYVDNKAMIALCQEHRLEHIALRYFLARELQQRGQLRLAYVATRANIADIFTKALPPVLYVGVLQVLYNSYSACVRFLAAAALCRSCLCAAPALASLLLVHCCHPCATPQPLPLVHCTAAAAAFAPLLLVRRAAATAARAMPPLLLVCRYRSSATATLDHATAHLLLGSIPSRRPWLDPSAAA